MIENREPKKKAEGAGGFSFQRLRNPRNEHTSDKITTPPPRSSIRSSLIILFTEACDEADNNRTVRKSGLVLI